jgi:hypothetical protein
VRCEAQKVECRVKSGWRLLRKQTTVSLTLLHLLQQTPSIQNFSMLAAHSSYVNALPTNMPSTTALRHNPMTALVTAGLNHQCQPTRTPWKLTGYRFCQKYRTQGHWNAHLSCKRSTVRQLARS